MRTCILILVLLSQIVFADTPPPGTVKAKTWSGDGATSITATGTALDVNVTNATGLTTVNQGTGGASAWKVDGSSFTQPVSGTFWQATQPVSGSLGRTWTLLSSTDSVDVGNFPAAFGRTWSLTSGSDSVSAVQSGVWTTGRTWNLSSGSDSVTVVGSISATNSANGPSGSPTPVDTTQVGGSDGTNLRAFKVSSTGVLSVDGSATTQPVSAAALPLPAGASTSANQATEIASLASIDSKLTAPVSTSRTWSLLNSTDSVNAVQSGAWSTGRTWTLLNTTDSVNVGNFPATQPVSGTVTANAGTDLNTSLLALQSGANTFLDIKGSGSLTNTGQQVGSAINGMATCAFTVSGTWSGTMNIVGQVNGATAVALPPISPAGTPVGFTYFIAANGTYLVNCAGYDHVYIQFFSYTSGTATINYEFGSGANNVNVSLISTAANGSAVPVRSQLVAGSDGTNARNISTDTSGYVNSNVQNIILSGTGTGTALNQTPIPDTDASRYQCLKFQVTGTFTATMTMEGSSDDVNWLSIYFKDVNVTNTAQNQTVTNTGGGSVFQMPINTRRVRLRVSAFTSGTATVTYDFSTLPCSQDMGIRTVTINGSVATTLTSGTLTSQAVTTDIVSAARTTTFTSGNINPAQGSMSESYGLNVTAVSGTNPTMDCTIFESNDTAANYQAVYQFERVTATGQYWVPMRRVSGNRLQYQCVIAGTTPSFTFTLFRIDSQAAAPMMKRYFDRTIAPNSLNSTTAAFNIDGCDKVAYGAAMSAITTTAPTFDIQLSEDGTSYESQGSTINPAANSSESIQALNALSKFARLIVTSAGSGATLNYAWLRCAGR